MKKILLVFAAILFTATVANAQVDGKAIGLRFGLGGEISYQQPIGGEANRLELDLGLLGFNFNSLSVILNGTYQWVWGIGAIDGLNWYAGIGAGAGLFYKTIAVGVNAQIGIEYNFPKLPIQVSLDYRPIYFFGLNNGGGTYTSWDGACLSVRYKF